MIRKVSVLMALITVMAVIAVSVGVLELNPLAAQETPTASRSFSANSVDAGGQVTVTITADGYGAFGDVAETLPAGFTYSTSSLPEDQVTSDGQTVTGETVTFALLGGTPPTTFTYTVRASRVEGAHSFTGVFSGVDEDFDPVSGVQVGGDPSITVAATTTPPASGPTASRSFSANSVDAGGQVTVTITADGYGAFGDVAETLPAGFTYSTSSLPEDQVTSDGQTVTGETVTFALLGGTPPTTFTYTVRASRVEGAHSFTGVFSGVDEDFDPVSGVQVGGDPSITVAATTTPPASGPTASRSFSANSVDAGGQVTVTITADGYGAFGDVAETLPAGFTYSTSSLPEDQVTSDGQTVTGETVTFALLGGTPPTTFTYTVRASRVEGAHSFTGVFSGVDADFDPVSGVQVGGDPSITVAATTTPPASGPTASRSFSPAFVAPGGQVTVTIATSGFAYGGVEETLPNGFAYIEDSIMPSDTNIEVDGQVLSFVVTQNPDEVKQFSYRVMAPSATRSYNFAGVLKYLDANNDPQQTNVTGVEAPATATPTPPPTPIIRPSQGGGGGYAPPVATATPMPTRAPSTPVPTIAATPTPIVVPTMAPTPEPTATSVPTLPPATPRPTAVVEPTEAPKPTAVPPTAVPPTEVPPTEVPPTEVPPTAMVEPTEPPAPTATTAPTVAPVPPVTPEEGGMPVWLIIVIIVAVVIAAIGFYLMRMRR